MPDNRKYSPSLMKKVEADRKEREKQLELQKKYNIEGDVTIKETGVLSGIGILLRSVFKLILALLAFVFLLIILYPETREIFISRFVRELPTSAVMVMIVPILYLLILLVRALVKKKRSSTS